MYVPQATKGQQKLRGEQKAELLQLADQRLKLELAPRPLHRVHHDKNVRVAQPIFHHLADAEVGIIRDGVAEMRSGPAHEDEQIQYRTSMHCGWPSTVHTLPYESATKREQAIYRSVVIGKHSFVT